MITILADDIGELGTVKLAPRSLQLGLLPHPASSSAAAAAALTKLAKLIRARYSSSRDLLPSHPVVGSRFFRFQVDAFDRLPKS